MVEVWTASGSVVGRQGEGGSAVAAGQRWRLPAELSTLARLLATQSGKSQGEAPPHRVHTAPVPCIIAEGGREEQVYVK